MAKRLSHKLHGISGNARQAVAGDRDQDPFVSQGVHSGGAPHRSNRDHRSEHQGKQGGSKMPRASEPMDHTADAISRDVQRKLNLSSRPSSRKDDGGGLPSAAAASARVSVSDDDNGEEDLRLTRKTKRIRATAEQAAAAAAAAAATTAGIASVPRVKKKKDKKKSGKKRAWMAGMAIGRMAPHPTSAALAAAGSSSVAAADGAAQPLLGVLGRRLSMQQGEAAAAAAAELWRSRCRQVLVSCLEEGHHEIIAKSVASWSINDVYDLIADWEPHVVAEVLSPELCSYERTASVMARFDAGYVASLCECWNPEEVERLLPRLKLKKARKVLELLYFKSNDPYLSTAECKQVLLGFSEQKRAKLCRRLNAEQVRYVLHKEGEELTEDGSDWEVDSEGGDESEGGDGDYEGSFIDDDTVDNDDNSDEDVEMHAAKGVAV